MIILLTLQPKNFLAVSMNFLFLQAQERCWCIQGNSDYLKGNCYNPRFFLHLHIALNPHEKRPQFASSGGDGTDYRWQIGAASVPNSLPNLHKTWTFEHQSSIKVQQFSSRNYLSSCAPWCVTAGCGEGSGLHSSSWSRMESRHGRVEFRNLRSAALNGRVPKAHMNISPWQSAVTVFTPWDARFIFLQVTCIIESSNLSQNFQSCDLVKGSVSYILFPLKEKDHCHRSLIFQLHSDTFVSFDQNNLV